MKRGEQATIKMQKTLLVGTNIDKKEYPCEVLRYDVQTECLSLIVKGGNLANISLDAFYECSVKSKEPICCIGQVKERYCEGAEAVIKLQIKNGFYKININSVDKQNT